MLASRVAHASAKGRSRESGYRAIVWLYPKVCHENFSSQLPLKATLLDPVATCFNDLRNVGALHQGNILGLSIPANDEGESGWFFRQNPHRSHVQWDVRGSELGKCFRLASVACKRFRAVGQQWEGSNQREG
jgi:hypothetical protein